MLEKAALVKENLHKVSHTLEERVDAKRVSQVHAIGTQKQAETE